MRGSERTETKHSSHGDRGKRTKISGDTRPQVREVDGDTSYESSQSTGDAKKDERNGHETPPEGSGRKKGG